VTKPVRPKILIPLLLFLATVLTTVTAGALYQGVNVFADPAGLAAGIPFSGSLLLILGTHELGHFIASRRHGVTTTLPIFIPGPPIPPMIGTFGAVIRIKSAIPSKAALVDIGSSGPLSGFAIALVVTAWGLSRSTIVPYVPTGAALGFGESLIFKLLEALTIGNIPDGHELILHPVAFAGWIGMFVTAMNLLPIGQLDGGHIVYAVIGPRHRVFSMVMIACLAVLGIFTWHGWFIWGALIALIGVRHPPVEDQNSPMDGRRKALCAASLLVFVLTFMPTPFYIV